MLAFLGALISGFVIGLIARALKPGDNKMGWIMTIALGIGGSMIATYAGQFLHLYQSGEIAGYIASVLGAVVLLAIVEFVRKKGA